MKRYAALIIILGSIIYANSLNGKFVWDDRYLVTHNVYIKNWSYVTNIFTQDIGAGVGIKSTSYRPLQMLTYMIDHSLWKLKPWGYHLTNILFHIMAVLCIYWFANTLFGNRLLSLFSGILFVVHPVHTEAVTYISGRADPMALLFMLLAFIFYIKYINTSDILRYLLMFFLYILSLLSREGSMIFPALILLYHYTFKKALRLKDFLPLLTITLLYLFFRWTILKSPLPHNLSPAAFPQRLSGFFVAITNYLTLLFLPFNLHMEYGNIAASFSHPKAILGFAILVSLVIYAVKKRRNDKLIFFSISWFLITLLPVSNIYPLNTYMAEHWLYLPSVGFFIVLAKFLDSLYKKEKLRVFGIIVIAGLSVFYSYLTIRQNNYWKEPIAFYERLLKYAPDSSRLHNDVGIAYTELGRTDLALNLFKKSIEEDPGYAYPYNNIGYIYNSMGKNEEAITFFKKAIETDPAFADPYNNLGGIYNSTGKYEEAIELYKKALEINPYYAAAHNNIAIVYYNTGHYELAVKHCNKALALGFKVNPEFLKTLEQHRK